MAGIEITGAPQETLAVLPQRATRAHQSLEEFVLGLLITESSAPTVDELVDPTGRRTGGELSFSASVQLVRDDRVRR